MGNIQSGKGFLTALLISGLVALVACGAAKPQPPPTAPPVEKDVPFEKGQKVKTVTVKRGEVIKFIAANLEVFVVIPDPNFEPGNGCEDWTAAASYVAFRIDKGSARVIVPDTYPDPDREKTIWYSVMVFDGADSEYLHGENPPPKIIIPKR